VSTPAPKLLKSERRALFEAARHALTRHLEDGARVDPWFRSPGVSGRTGGRDVEVRFPRGCQATWARVGVRVRTGPTFVARRRAWPLSWVLGRVKIRGQYPGDSVSRALKELFVREHAFRASGGGGWVRLDLPWERDRPDPGRILRVLAPLDEIARWLEELPTRVTETGGAIICPFCRDLIDRARALVRCDACGTPHHPACFEENAGCAAYGCRNHTARIAAGRVAQELDPPTK
jgi:hypothetical protein